MQNTSDLKSFHYLENGEINFSVLDTIKTEKTLQSGIYNLNYLDYPEHRVTLKENQDKETTKIHEFASKEKIDLLLDRFFNKDIYKMVKHLGFYHKTGILFYGKEGTGKSSIMKYYYTKAIEEEGALVFHILRSDFYLKKCWDFIMNVRRIQPNPIIVIFEEIDSYLKDNTAFLKTAFDGNNSIDNCIILASTNHINEIPEALKDRPSRFKYSLNIEGIQKEEDVLIIIEKLLNNIFPKDDLDLFSKELKGSTLDEIKQFCMDKIMNLKSSDIAPTRARIGFNKQ